MAAVASGNPIVDCRLSICDCGSGDGAIRPTADQLPKIVRGHFELESFENEAEIIRRPLILRTRPE